MEGVVGVGGVGGGEVTGGGAEGYMFFEVAVGGVGRSSEE